MEQLVQELKIYTIDSRQFNPRRDAMPVKRIMDTPIFHNSGLLRIPIGDSTCFYELNDVNYVWLDSSHNFDLLINDSVIINTSQFSYINQYRNIKVAIQSVREREQQIQFVYGNFELGDEDTGLYVIRDNCGAKWDRVLKNIVMNINSDSLSSTCFPQIGPIELEIGG